LARRARFSPSFVIVEAQACVDPPPPYRPRAKQSSRRFWEERGFATQERGRVEVGQKERGAGGIRRSGMDAPSRGVGRSLVGWMERGDGAIGG
jgi:hypothetical protein